MRRPCHSAGYAENLPAFNNRHATYCLTTWEGQERIVYRLPGEQSYPEEVIEALKVVEAHPCTHLPLILAVERRRVVAEYLDGYAPLSKAGVTSSRYCLWGRKPKRFKRYHLRAEQQDVAEHFDGFIMQLQSLAMYLQAHALWHDDVLPQNVMWNRSHHRMKLVDIGALCPIEQVREGRRAYYRDGRTSGVYQADYRVNRQYVSKVFLQDLDPWPIVMLRKLGIGIRK